MTDNVKIEIQAGNQQDFSELEKRIKLLESNYGLAGVGNAVAKKADRLTDITPEYGEIKEVYELGPGIGNRELHLKGNLFKANLDFVILEFGEYSFCINYKPKDKK